MFVSESVKCKSGLSGPEDWILRYISTCHYFFDLSLSSQARFDDHACLYSVVLVLSMLNFKYGL